MPTAIVLRSNNEAAGSGLRRLARDPLLYDEDVAAATQYLADVAFGWCYSAGSPVPANATLRDMTERERDGVVRIGSGGAAPTIIGNGMDFGAVDKGATNIEVPASVTEAIVALGHNFLGILYMRLPSAENWPLAGAGTWNEGWYFADGCTGFGTWRTQAELFNIRMLLTGGVPQLGFRVQQALNSAAARTFSPIDPSAQGSLVQLAFWRTSTQMGMRVRSPSAIQSVEPLARPANNSLSLTGRTIRLGCGMFPTAAAFGTEGDKARQMRFYRVAFLATDLLTKPITTLLDEDYSRTIARGVFG